MFNKTYEERLILWRKFRASLETSETPIEDVIMFYKQAPQCKLHTNPWDQSTWPNPWEVLKENEYCDFTRVLAICYSLQLTDCFKGSNFEIHISTDNSLGYVYLLSVDNKIIGWDDGVVDKKDLPKDLESQLIYPMPPLH